MQCKESKKYITNCKLDLPSTINRTDIAVISYIKLNFEA